MHEYRIHTLVDITENGDLKKAFPFKTLSGQIVHDAHSLEMAKNQNANFTTLMQLLQMRGNITWEDSSIRTEKVLTQEKIFGNHYDGKHLIWTFVWHTEQQDVYREGTNPVGQLENDFDNVPVINFCKESATFPSSAFITKDSGFKNTVFNYLGVQNK
jgi:hypothetical protein